jgi:hypothetical protein
MSNNDFIGGHFEFKMADVTKSVNDINNALNRFLVSEYVWFDTKIKRFDGLELEICKSKIVNGRHFENPKWPPK